MLLARAELSSSPEERGYLSLLPRRRADWQRAAGPSWHKHTDPKFVLVSVIQPVCGFWRAGLWSVKALFDSIAKSSVWVLEGFFNWCLQQILNPASLSMDNPRRWILECVLLGLEEQACFSISWALRNRVFYCTPSLTSSKHHFLLNNLVKATFSTFSSSWFLSSLSEHNEMLYAAQLFH